MTGASEGMTFTELADVIGRVSAADGRDRSATAHAVTWHEVIGHLPRWLALEATVRVLSDPTIAWYRPAHVLAEAVRIQEEIDTLASAYKRRHLALPSGALTAARREEMARRISTWNTTRVAQVEQGAHS